MRFAVRFEHPIALFHEGNQLFADVFDEVRAVNLAHAPISRGSFHGMSNRFTTSSGFNRAIYPVQPAIALLFTAQARFNFM
jgi:hypothetical protein